MPKGVAKSGLRMTKQRLAAFELTNPELAKQYKEQQAKKNPLFLVQQIAENLTPRELSDAEIEKRLRTRFSTLEIMAQATIHGMNRALVISGPGGIGKSYGVMKAIDAADKSKFRIKHVTGFMRLTGLYKLLFENRHPHCTLVFDDSDSIYADEDKLNMLKAATDTKDVRTISWGAETRMETEDGQALPKEFVFEGSVIFLTNKDLIEEGKRGGRLAPHFEALVSRTHYLDLNLRSPREYIIRIRQVCALGMLRVKGIDADAENDILDFIEEYQDQLIETSLRMVLKVADLVKMSPDNWIALAETMCLKDE